MNNSSPIAREGYPFIAGALGVMFLLIFSTFMFCSVTLSIFATLSVLVALFVIYFFRDPARTPTGAESNLVAPADGTVIVAERVSETPLGCESLKISIFMSVFNVHVNRVPIGGTVINTFYNPGKFLDARDGNSSFENERSGIILETVNGTRICFVQIAGLIARRIICYAKPGDKLLRGNRYGLIRFGSRVDIYLPVDVEPMVKLGDKTVAGETILGCLR